MKRSFSLLSLSLFLFACSHQPPKEIPHQIVIGGNDSARASETKTPSTSQTFVNHFKSINEVVNDKQAIAWKTGKDSASCALHFNMGNQKLLSVEYSPECWIMFPLKTAGDSIVVYWSYLIDSKLDLPIVTAVKQVNKKYKDQIFMTLKLINDSTLSAHYPNAEIRKQLNASDKKRILFPDRYTASKNS